MSFQFSRNSGRHSARSKNSPGTGAQVGCIDGQCRDRYPASTRFPAVDRIEFRSTTSLERPNGEIERPAEAIGILPNEMAIPRLVDAILLEQSDEQAVQRALCTTLDSIAPIGDDLFVGLPSLAA